LSGILHRSPSHHEGRAAAAGTLDVRILQIESRRHELVLEIEHRPVEIEEALAIDQELGASVLEDAIAVALLIDVHLVGEPRAAPTGDLDAPSALLDPPLGDERLYLLRGLVRDSDRRHGQLALRSPAMPFLRFQSSIAALMPSSASTEQCILTGGSESSCTI